ncbi:ubiquitin carboxyl-terminal hydrolase 37-like [Synchiropus splendidus]|uniref:ubiquitin carboxyl-terminal hydrolase 37-like n=1 Tax=Synchiropus splendidus TaxID=270530 RepID=UPI00237E6B61|nr:ubiquitin carboxyl-terminal hydrolase 37-like [Synchiropus splendidus]
MLWFPNSSSELFTCTGRRVTPVVRPLQQQVALSVLPQSTLCRELAAIKCRRWRLCELALQRLGLPNIGNSCYMNVVLQSLLSLEPFMREVQNQACTNAMIFDQTFISSFIRVAKSRLYGDSAEKLSAVSHFKNSIGALNSHFFDDHQKSAQKCLLTILSSWEGFSTNMKMAAGRLGMNYKCPVGTNIAFEALRSSSCKRCGWQRKVKSHEVFLSLQTADSVSQALGNVLNERPADVRCRRCGSHLTDRLSFSTLPNVLILSLCRVRRTASRRFIKVPTAVHLCQDLQVATLHKEQAQYKLVTIVNRLGSTSHEGHYSCDTMLKDNTPRWLTFDDDKVEVQPSSLLAERRQTALLLFYVKS